MGAEDSVVVVTAIGAEINPLFYRLCCKYMFGEALIESGSRSRRAKFALALLRI